MDHGSLYILLAIIFGFCVAWSVGANDLANVMSTAIGSKAITARQALVIAVIFEFAGALIGGHGVATTISTGIINPANIANATNILVQGMLAVLLAAGSWLLLASVLGMPVSITQTIVGSIFGFGLLVLGPHAIHWQQMTYILITWISSPTIAGFLAYLLFMSVQHLILSTPEPLHNARRYVPIYLFLVGFILTIITVIRALKHFEVHLNFLEEGIIAVGLGLLVTFVGRITLNRVGQDDSLTPRLQFFYIERMFGLLMLLTACAMVFAHGSNDVAIAMGPVAAVIDLLAPVEIHKHSEWLYFILAFGCVGVVTGLLMYGRKVIETVGSNITALTPSRAFCATLAAAMAVVISTSIGIPVSATQTLVGAILGVGLARGIGALDLGIVRNIFLSWMITIPVGAGLTIAYFFLMKQL